MVTVWKNLLMDVVGRRNLHLNERGGERLCLEAEIQKTMPAAVNNQDSKALLIQRGSSKKVEDIEAALERIQRMVHIPSWKEVAEGRAPVQVGASRRAMVEGDQETYSLMIC